VSATQRAGPAREDTSVARQNRGTAQQNASAAAPRITAVAADRLQPPPVPPRGRSEQRNAAVRATLVPYAAGERPWSIKIAALIALFVGAGDLVDVIVGGRSSFGGTHTGVLGVVLFSLLMIVCAVGMWRMRYWAVLGFQAMLAIVVLIFALLLVRASNLLGFVVPIVIIGAGGTLFFKLVRVLSRLQMPRYPDR
jgi:hypothetical protein